MEQTTLTPKEIVVEVEQKQTKTNKITPSKVTYKPLLQPIYDKKTNKYYTFKEYNNNRACICINLQDKEGNTVKNNDGSNKTLYKFTDKILLKQELNINETPFQDKNIAFQYIETYKEPRFEGQIPNSRGFYSDWSICRDDYWNDIEQ